MFQINENNAIDYLVQKRFLSPREAKQSCATELKGGVSNITIQIQTPDRCYVLKQALEKLRVQMDWYSDVRRIHVETDCIRRLGELIGTELIPEIFFEDRADHLYVMASAPPGASTWKQQLLAGKVDLSVAEKLGRLLGQIHQKTHDRGVEIARQFDNDEFFIQLRVDPYYNTIARVHTEIADEINSLSQQMFKNKLCLVHGDYSPKNILVKRERILLIDFEVAHYGDPVFDLAFFLTHLRLKAFHLPDHREALYESIRRFWKAYTTTVSFLKPDLLEPRFIRHWGCILLARLDGKSPAEYLQPPTKAIIRPFSKRLIRGEMDRIEDCLVD